jgi:hypothetical protein
VVPSLQITALVSAALHHNGSANKLANQVTFASFMSILL